MRDILSGNLKSNDDDGSETLLKKNKFASSQTWASIWTRLICQMQVIFSGVKLLS